MSESVYVVEGMTCGHCAAAVTREISRIDGVHDVEVDVAAGTVAVTANAEPDAGSVAAAVAEAGYVLVGRG